MKARTRNEMKTLPKQKQWMILVAIACVLCFLSVIPRIAYYIFWRVSPWWRYVEKKAALVGLVCSHRDVSCELSIGEIITKESLAYGIDSSLYPPKIVWTFDDNQSQNERRMVCCLLADGGQYRTFIFDVSDDCSIVKLVEKH